MKVALFGASGFIGSAIAHSLRSADFDVVEISTPRLTSTGRTVEMLKRNLSNQVEDLTSLVDRLRPMDVVVNAAGISEATDAWTDELAGANSLTPSVLASLADQAEVPRFVHVSSAAVLGNGALDSSENWKPASHYAESKSLGEELLLSLLPQTTLIVIYRPPGVHDANRQVTQKIARVARSAASSFAGDDTSQSPQALLGNVADAVRFLTSADSPPRVVAHPWEGQTTKSLLTNLGAQHRPKRIPSPIAKAAIAAAKVLKINPAQVRRIEVLWFGQRIATSWLETAGWRPALVDQDWATLGQKLLNDSRHETRSPRIVFAVTASLQVPYLGRTPGAFADDGWDVHVVSAAGPELASLDQGSQTHIVDMVRDPSPIADLRSLLAWLRLLRKLRPDAVLLGTPKASLVGLLAAKISRVPVRTYLLRGLRLETATGPMAKILWLLEKVAIWCSTEVLAISPSLAERVRELGLGGTRQINVIGSGSSHGIDLSKFDGVDGDNGDEAPTRAMLGIPSGEFVVGFVGRVRSDKGVPELLEAIRILSNSEPAWLILIGRVEEPALIETIAAHNEDGRIIALDHVENIERYYPLFDALCLPSHREGFGNVVIEAAAFGVPSVVSDATGVRDTVMDRETGLIVGLKKVQEIAAALNEFRDRDLAQDMGQRAQERARREFDDVALNQKFVEHLNISIGERRSPGRAV